MQAPALLSATGAPIVQQIEPSDPEQAYLDALRERKMYRLLESYCQRQMRRPDATAADRARYTIELANILAARAQTETNVATRAESWNKASALLRQFLETHQRHPQAMAIQFQIGVYELAQGELSRQQAQLVPHQREFLDAARGHLREAIFAFRQVDVDASQAMKVRAPGDGANVELPSHAQLRALVTNTRYRLAQSLLAMAQTYPRHSADQTEWAAQAKTLYEAFTQRYSPSELTVESFLGRAECLRLLGDAAEAIRTLRELQKGNPPPPDEVADRALVLLAQIHLDQKNPAAARNFIEDSRRLLSAPSAELELLYVQSLLELAREQSRLQSNLVARQLVASALEAMQHLEKDHGSYWVGRGELLLAELASDSVLVEDPAVLSRMADGQYRRGDFAGTVKTLDRAVKLTAERGDADQSVELAFRAASILVQQKRHEAAGERFAQIATTYANHSKAPQAHFMTTYCLGQLYAAESTPERLAAYERSLEQHLRAYDADETAAEVRWLLGSLRMHQRRWQDAIELFRHIPPHGRQAVAAREQTRRAYDLWLDEVWLRGQPSEAVTAAAIEFLKQALAGRRDKALTAADVPMVLSLARIHLHPTVGRPQDSEDILNDVLFGRAANDSHRGEARRLMVAALLGQDKFDEARRMIETEFVGVPQELFAVVQSLEEAAVRSAPARRRPIGQLQLVATERLAKDAEELTPEQSVQTEIYLALAYVNAGQPARADELFAKLRDRIEGDPRVLEAQAECFMQLGRYSQARDLWRQLLGMLPDDSLAWYRAKYNLALACYHSGDVAQSLKIILVTEQLHPDLGGPEMKSKFDELKAKCRSRS